MIGFRLVSKLSQESGSTPFSKYFRFLVKIFEKFRTFLKERKGELVRDHALQTMPVFGNQRVRGPAGGMMSVEQMLAVGLIPGPNNMMPGPGMGMAPDMGQGMYPGMNPMGPGPMGAGPARPNRRLKPLRGLGPPQLAPPGPPLPTLPPQPPTRITTTSTTRAISTIPYPVIPSGCVNN